MNHSGIISQLAGIIIILLIVGTFFYNYIEKWNYLDAFYFSAMTITTVGYGDLAPTTVASKLFTVVYAFAGIGLVFLSITLMSKYYFYRKHGILKNLKIKEKKYHKKLRHNIIKGSKTH